MLDENPAPNTLEPPSPATTEGIEFSEGKAGAIQRSALKSLEGGDASARDHLDHLSNRYGEGDVRAAVTAIQDETLRQRLLGLF